jgi:addiction module RelE/StbE family toxin
MQILFTEKFKKNFSKLPEKIQNKFKERIDIFAKSPTNPLLKTHPLKGHMIGFRAFSVTGDHRVIFKIVAEDTVKLIDIGTHSQIY